MTITFDEKLRGILLQSHIYIPAENFFGADSLFDEGEPTHSIENIIWGTDSYAEQGRKPEDSIENDEKQLELIIPRVEKNKAEQKKRTKDKAEVFTPTWVTTLQNSLVDDHVLGRKAFGEFDENDRKLWIPSKRKIFTKAKIENAISYIASPRLEITCGEAPYLMHRYDTTTGENISVKDDLGRFQRSGLLDRKLRVVSEIATKETWVELALVALKSIYGYEWQGDNLYIARKNFVLTFVEFYEDFFGEEPDRELIEKIAEIASWQLWQMDGLKMVKPLSCENCTQCEKKEKRVVHLAGKKPALRWNEKLITFGDFLPNKK